MDSRVKWRALLIICLIVFSSFASEVNADHVIHLSNREQAFLQANPEIRLAAREFFEALVIVDQDGTIRGYEADMIALVNQMTGANFVLHISNFPELNKQIKSVQLDGFTGQHAGPKADEAFLLSDVYLSLKQMLLVEKYNPKKIHARQDLVNRTIVILEGDLIDQKFIKNYPQSKVLSVNTLQEKIKAVVDGVADAAVGNALTLHIAEKNQLSFLQPAFFMPEAMELKFAIRKDWPEAISILNKALAAIGESGRLRLQNKWFQDAVFSTVTPVELTQGEVNYLHQKEFIAMCTDPDWMPYEQITDDARHGGILGDYHRLWSQKIGKEIRLIKTQNWSQSLEYMKQRRCDILSSAQKTRERLHYMNFTRPFVAYPIVLATRVDELFFEDFEPLLKYEMAIVKGYSTIGTLREKYPEIKIVEVDSPKEGLQKVSRGQVFGFIDTVATIGYQTQTHGILNIKISAVLDEKYNMSVAVRNDQPELLSIFNKAVDSVTPSERYGILNKWISIKYEQSNDYDFFWKIIAAILFILILVFYRERVISHYNRKLQKLNQHLQRMSRTDPLTKVANRHSLTDFFRQEVARKKRYHSCFSVIMVDLDHFKRVNDRYGHNVGDQVLVTVAEILSANIRINDVVGRWGGEEFIILCPQSNRNGVLQMAEMLRKKIDTHHFFDVDHLTASFGVTSYDEKETMESFIKRVDDALYEAKSEGGRNCVKSR